MVHGGRGVRARLRTAFAVGTPAATVLGVLALTAVVAALAEAFDLRGWNAVAAASLIVVGGLTCAGGGIVLWLRADSVRSARLGVLGALFAVEAVLGIERMLATVVPFLADAGAGASAVVSLLSAFAVGVAALLAMRPPQHTPAQRLGAVAAVAVLGAVPVLAHARVPDAFTPDGGVVAWSRFLWVVAALFVTAATGALWRSQRIQLGSDWALHWPLLGLLLAAAGVVLRALSEHRDDPMWWASLALTSLAGVVAACGLLYGGAVLMARLEGFAERLAGRLETEVRLASDQERAGGSDDDAASAPGMVLLPLAAQEREQRVAAVLAGRGLTPVLQAVVDLDGGQVTGLEALTRVVGPPTVPPSQLFAAAAEAGVARDVELLAVRRALSILPDLPPDPWLAVNVSPATAASPELAELLRGSNARRLVLELTEHVAVESYDALVDALSVLREAGVRIAVDDAGAGFSSFRHVVRLHPDIVKLDMSLIAGIDTDPVRRALVSSLVHFTASIGAAVIAEGIETRGELQVLRGLGVRLGQGYLLGRPRPVDQALNVTLPDTAAAGARPTQAR